MEAECLRIRLEMNIKSNIIRFININPNLDIWPSYFTLSISDSAGGLVLSHTVGLHSMLSATCDAGFNGGYVISSKSFSSCLINSSRLFQGIDGNSGGNGSEAMLIKSRTPFSRTKGDMKGWISAFHDSHSFL